MKKEDESSYRSIIKATSVFGGVQFINILISVVKSKLIAIILGPTGMGISSLFTSTIGLVGSLTNFGLATSGVKNVAVAASKNDGEKVEITAGVLKKLVWLTGLLGTIVTLILSHWLSKIVFGNSDWTISFIILSISLLFAQLSAGELVILQGFRRVKELAKANIIGSVAGLIISISLYYFFGVNGIVPSIVILSINTFLIAAYFSKKISLNKVNISNELLVKEGAEMLKMGFLINLGAFITLGSSYILQIFINKKSGTAEVGLYNAGFAIINTYVGMIFTAMSTDYYPRLSVVAFDKEKANKTINQQAEIALLVLTPVLVIFITFINWIIIVMYSHDFMRIQNMLHWATLGIIFKAASWSIAFIILAKGDSRIFFVNELMANLIILTINIGGYLFWGLNGLGISFLIGYFIYFIQVLILAKHRYQFAVEAELIKIFFTVLTLTTLSFLTAEYASFPFNYIGGVVIFLLSAYYSYKKLSSKLDLSGFKNRLMGKINKQK